MRRIAPVGALPGPEATLTAPTRPSHQGPPYAARVPVSPVAVVVGGAAAALDELDAARGLCAASGEVPTIIAVNDQIARFPDEIIAVTLHYDRLLYWIKDRAARGYPAPVETWAWWRPPRMPGLVTHVTAQWDGSSGLHGVAVALQRGHAKVILAGVPMDAGAGHIAREGPWVDCERYRKGWIERMPQLIGRVRSMSGWTAARLGTPTAEWLTQ